MFSFTRPQVRKWAYAWEQQADVGAIRGKLGIFQDVIVNGSLTIANNPINDFLDARLLQTGVYPSTRIAFSGYGSTLGDDAYLLYLQFGQNAGNGSDVYGGCITVHAFEEAQKGAHAEIEMVGGTLQAQRLGFTLRFWDRFGAPLAVDTLNVDLSVHMWRCNGHLLVHSVYTAIGPGSEAHPDYPSATGLFLRAVASSDGPGDSPIAIA
jgi:hypothetical protein